MLSTLVLWLMHSCVPGRDVFRRWFDGYRIKGKHRDDSRRRRPGARATSETDASSYFRTWVIRYGFSIGFIASTLCLAWTAERPHAEMVHGQRAQSSFPFRAAGVYWPDPSTTAVRARASADGQKWTRWIESHGE